MAPRALWKGYLKLSLVSCAVAMFTATTASERIRFNMLNRKTGHRLKQQYVDSATGELVEPEDRARGYQVAKNEYIVIDDEEIDTIQIESTHTVTVDKFVPRKEIDELYLDTSYYLAPDDRVAVEAFSVIRDAMADSGMVGLARVVLHRREHVVMLEPRGRGILVTTLHYPYEVRSQDAIFEEIQPIALDKETLGLAKTIIESKRGKFDPSSFEDHYENALIALVKSKQAGERPQAPAPAAPPSNVVNLMDALKRSLAAEGKELPARPRAEPRASRAAAKSARKTPPRQTRAKKKLRKAG